MRKLQLNPFVSKTVFVFGTANTVTVGIEHRKVMEEVKDILLSFHKCMSIYESTSEISSLNHMAGSSSLSISPEIYDLIRRSVAYSKLTNGAFDITALPLKKIWQTAEQIPTEAQIHHAKKLVNYRNIVFSDNKIMLKYSGMGVDLGGIAKGFAVDKITELLKSRGIASGVINFGGSVFVLGEERSVGIQTPFGKKGRYIGTIRVKNKAVVTSGAYENYRVINGTAYQHILNPHTGYPVNNELLAVTLIGAKAEELDALATGVCVMGIQKGYDLLKKRQIDAIFIKKDGSVLLTEGIKESFSFKEATYEA
ncbi:FAD:protein FMN transferase [Negativibacillus massiliensis]|uniref:FAD:protein FMN transferase n=1 Tax=Negativibacillus massiliensis TaxID=1871035 RepID=UPI003AF773D3